MPITYVREFSRLAEAHYDDARFGNDFVLLFDPVLERSKRSLGDRFRNIDPAFRTGSDLIVVRGGCDILEDVDNDAIFRRLVDDTPIVVLRPMRGGPGNEFASPSWSAALTGQCPALETMRDVEVTDLLRRGEAIWGDGDQHFILPSGDHASAFIRLADALRDPVDLQRLADWVMSYLSAESAVIADTSSILAFLLTIQTLARERYGWTLPFEALDEYPGDAATLAQARSHLTARVSVEQPKILLLVSVNSSGRLIRIFRSLAQPSDPVLAICNTAPNDALQIPGGITTFATHPVQRWIPDATGVCPGCDVGARIEIHPRTYERLPSAECKLIPIGPHQAERNARFWQIADKTDAIRLHVDVDYPGEPGLSRHLAVSLDIPKLLSDTTFREECVEKLRSLPRPDNVLIPRHGASESIAKLVLDAYATPPAHFSRENIHVVESGPLSNSVVNAIRNTDHLLIADDALVNGTTLIGLRIEAYCVTQLDEAPAQVHAFVAVARPRNDSALKRVERPYRDDNGIQLTYAHKVYLPGGFDRERACPWCAERQLLQSYLGKLHGDAAKYARSRIARLHQGELSPPILLSLDVATNGGNGTDLVTRRSFFGELRQIAAFAAGTSVAQEALSKIDAHNYRLPREVVDLKLIRDAYFEASILAPILRTLPKRALRASRQDQDVSEDIRAIPATAYPGAFAELGWAAISGKVPERAVYERLNHVESPDRAIKMLKDILRLQLEGS